MSKDLSIFENVQMFEYNSDAFTLDEVEYKFSEVYELPEYYHRRGFVPWFDYAAVYYLHVVIHKRMQDLKKKYCE